MIRNIIFDMGHVLLWYDPLPACRALTKTEADALALHAAYAGGPLWAAVDMGTLDGEAFTGAVKQLLPEKLHAAVDAMYLGMPENILFPMEGMPELVDGLLTGGYHVYLLSNAGRFMSRKRYMVPHIDRFHGVLFSGDENIIKPDPRIYKLLMSRYGLKPEECFFIDDKPDNLQAAAALGWQTHRFTGDVAALQKELDAL